ncbi:MAG: SMC-Scp complex subunit ScpB [Candidatus Omnitrophica bacterium]|nr:SMC-Scp complex subunit ScpB [Candidatus Omnitrophota bacterium]
MDVVQAKRILEGLLFVSPEPVTAKRLKVVLPGLDQSAIRRLIDELNADYAQHGHAFVAQEVAGGYRLVTDPQLGAWIKRAMEMPREDALSKRALETLAIVAYKQPITKAEIEAIRGVDVSGTLETLLEHRFVEIAGRKDTPGRPLLYGTTIEFLRHFGLKSLAGLPPLGSGAMPTLPGSGGADSPPQGPVAVPETTASPEPGHDVTDTLSTQPEDQRDPAAAAQPD